MKILKKLAYDNAVSQAEQLINQLNDPTMDISNIQAITQKVIQAKIHCTVQIN